MAEIKEIKKDIIKYITNKNSKNSNLSKIILKVEEELEILGTTVGLESKNNLESFYSTWKTHKGQVGHKNDINSWTAFFLDITDAKPEKGAEFLPTRRAFARAGFPDIDTDFDYENRDTVYAYIIDKYGRENVGNIGTHGLLKFKSCVTRVTKALDLADSYHKGSDAFVSDNAAKVTEILSPFPKKGLVKVTDDDGQTHLIKTFKDAYDHCPDFRHYVDKYKDSNFKEYMEQIEGTFANFGYHAAGIVVSDVPLDQIAPLRNAKKGVLATQYPNEDLELLGLIKFDVLAIATLSVIKKTVEAVKENWGIEIDVENIPLEDEATFEIYRKGNLGGVFQCEKHGMQKTMRDIGCDRFEDIVAGLALFRPGPMDSIPEYCARKHHEKDVDYFHKSIEPFVKPYLESTYGVLCYQEQVMQICNSLAGFTITDGYIMIKAIGKKKTYLMEKFEEQFIYGCVKNKVPKEIAKQYWDKFIVPFAGYGFNLCLDGSMTVKNKKDGKTFYIEELEKLFRDNEEHEVLLDSYKDGEIIEDEVVDVFCTGEKDVYEIELDNGIILRCTLDHKFVCDDGKEYAIKDIIEKDLNILYFKDEIFKKCKVKSVKYLEKRRTFNLTMKSSHHNYALYDRNSNNSIISLNSHSACYGYNSYSTAYLKANYPDEFICSLLDVTINNSQGERYDKVSAFEKEFVRKMGVKFLPRDINKSKVSFTIEKRKDPDEGVKKTEIRPSLLCKGLLPKSAQNIEDNQPYSDLRDFIRKTDSSLIDIRVIEALALGGYFGKKYIEKSSELVKDFVMIREDMKKTSKKGVETVDLFA